MDDDMNTADAITSVYTLVRVLNTHLTAKDVSASSIRTAADMICELMGVLGLDIRELLNKDSGIPAEIMDLSFAVQAMSAMYIRDNHDKLENRVIDVSAEIDDIIARRKLDAWGVKIDELTQEQKKYLSSWEV
jgi:cysteinyl-tRNA synthetase